MDGKLEDRLAAFLESKRDSFEAEPGFEDRVMAAIRRGSAQARKAGGKARGEGRNDWAGRRTGWLGTLRGFLAVPRGRAVWVPACAALAVGMFLTARPFHGPAGSGGGEIPGGTRIKGEAFGFALLVQEGDRGYRRLEGEALLRAGDRVQALYWLADTAHVELLSLDAKGKAECYSCGKPSGPYGPAAGQPLPFGIELDSEPGPELFVLAASRDRQSADRFTAALARAWREAGGDLEKTAEGLRRGGGVTKYRTLMVRKGERS